MNQPLEGQLMAVHIYMCCCHKPQKRISDDPCNELLVASGMWAKVVDKFVPAILFTPALTTTLGNEFMSVPDFRTDTAQMASKYPPVAAPSFAT